MAPRFISKDSLRVTLVLLGAAFAPSGCGSEAPPAMSPAPVAVTMQPERCLLDGVRAWKLTSAGQGKAMVLLDLGL